jgi:hypothetical protein
VTTPVQGRSAAALRAILFALSAAACSRGASCQPGASQSTEAPAQVASVTIPDPGTYWTRNEFVEMTPPIRLPSGNGRERIAVWLRIPQGQRIRVLPDSTGRPSLAFPSGTIADRADMNDAAVPGSVQDVRGTRFAAGQEFFHVLRPTGGPGLGGVEWLRGDAAASRLATSTMRTRLAESHVGPAALALFERLNDCASCHVHDKPENVEEDPAGAEGMALPNRSTDSDGLYTIATVLTDSAPLEKHRARDMNEGDPYVSVDCADGHQADFQVHGRLRHFACQDGSVPRATLDMRRALAAGDAHARAVCESRSYLGAHMESADRALFAEAFTECGGKTP